MKITRLMPALLCFISWQSVAQINLSSGLVAYYPMSGTFADASGNGHNGTGINGVTFGPDYLGNPSSAAVFDGVDDYVSVASTPALTPGHEFSMSYRFKTTSPAKQMLFSKSQFGDATSFQYQVGLQFNNIPSTALFLCTDHTLTCGSVTFGSNYNFGNNAVLNQWHCVVHTFNNGIKRVYMDGALVSTVTVTGTANNTSIDSCIPGTFRMGVWWQGDPDWFKGSIDEVRLWNRALNPQEAAAICGLLPQPCFTISNLQDTVKLCKTSTVTLNPTVTGGSGFFFTDTTWTPATGLSNPNIINPVASGTAAGQSHILTVLGLSNQNLVSNGEFSTGNTGFSSGYMNAPGLITGAGQYKVVTNTTAADPAYTAFTDHTGNAGGQMIVADGHPTANTALWCQTIAVAPNTTYRIGAWAASAVSQNPASLQLMLDGIPQSSTVTLPATPGQWVPLQYTWNSGNATNVTICIRETSGTASGNSFALDDISVRTFCSATDSVFIRSYTLQTSINSTAGVNCASDSVQFAAVNSGALPTAYEWNFGDGTPVSTAQNPLHIYAADGSFTVRLITTLNGCKDTAFKTILLEPPFDAGTDRTICAGDSTQLQTVNGIAWLWSPATGLSCTTCANPVASPATTTTYTILGTNGNGCTESDLVTVTVIQRDPVGAASGGDICVGDSLLLSATGGTSYAWSPTVGLSCTTCANPWANPLLTTTYNVVITHGGTCFRDTIPVTVTVHEFPVVDAGPDQHISGGAGVLIAAVAPGSSQWTWTPAATLSCSNCLQPTASPLETTTYIIFAEDAYGCRSADTVTVFVSCEKQIWLPNSFTPNRDGKNDYFYPRSRDLMTIKTFRVYNRWGEQVFARSNFAANDKAAGWDGTYKGKDLSPNEFMYYVEATCTITGEPVFIKGSVTILR